MMWNEWEHKNPPPAFNPVFRPGLGDAVSAAYCEWCKLHPNAVQGDRKEAYLEISIRLTPEYPTVEELKRETRTVENS